MAWLRIRERARRSPSRRSRLSRRLYSALAAAALAVLLSVPAQAATKPSADQVKGHLLRALREIEAEAENRPFDGGLVIHAVADTSKAQRRGVLYAIDLMPGKGLLYLAERDGSGRLHTLFVDVLHHVTLR